MRFRKKARLIKKNKKYFEKKFSEFLKYMYSQKNKKKNDFDFLFKNLFLLLHDLTTISNDDGLGDHTGRSTNRLNVNRENIEASKNLTEDDVLTVQPRARDQASEHLRAVGVATSVGH